MNIENNSQRSIIAVIIGAPNVGKSTLINQWIGKKISIVTPKPQTTRTRITGVVNSNETQMVLLDTPGIFLTPRNRLERAMLHAAWDALDGADQIILVIDAKRGLCPDTNHVLETLKKRGLRAQAIINKLDIINHSHALPIAAKLQDSGIIDRIWMGSAKTGEGTDDVKKHLLSLSKPGHWWYEGGQNSIASIPFFASEVTREQVFLQLEKELPYISAVETEQVQKPTARHIIIHQAIYVMKDGQKAIILGQQGQRIKAISQAARLALTELLGCRVSLYLFVKVAPEWMEKRKFYQDLGLAFDA
jgi:GTP-binding protein Era